MIQNCDMRAFTSFKAGGRARLLVMPQNAAELQRTLAVLSGLPARSEQSAPYMVIGNGSNILVKDSGYAGTLVKLGEAFASVEWGGDCLTVGAGGDCLTGGAEGDCLTAGAGALLSAVAKKAMEAGLAGLEFASGIPGSVGGAVFMNAGAYGGEMRDVLECVEVISLDGAKTYTLTKDELKFGYRYSILQSTGDVAISAVFRLERGDPAAIGQKMKELADKRNAKQPVTQPSAGSFFKRPEGHYAGRLIEDAGLKGVRVGGARVSPLHAGFIVNENGATATDIIDLARLVQNTVQDKFGVLLEPEARIIGD